MSEPSDNGLAPSGGPFRPELLPLVFLIVAGILFLDPWSFSSPVASARKVADWVLDPSPVRKPSFSPETKVGAYTYQCSDCHRLISSPEETERSLTQHENIVFEHGLNTRCFNCHERENRDVFSGEGSQIIPFDKPELLCAKCHGPVYRDWLHRVHGRTNGYWDGTRGEVERRSCVECHDPHSPSFPSMTPAPAPETLRMGQQKFLDEHAEEVPNPLQIYRKAFEHNQSGELVDGEEEDQEVVGEASS